ncbi:hypothetical protein G7054_g12110 [Neopestalotiopsis clavispora]|nr:hypothetical protein G7054_g12110 [Neopestalotiopsis clavispora]
MVSVKKPMAGEAVVPAVYAAHLTPNSLKGTEPLIHLATRLDSRQVHDLFDHEDERVTEEQLAQIAKLPRTPNADDKWSMIYKIIFPNDKASEPAAYMLSIEQLRDYARDLPDWLVAKLTGRIGTSQQEIANFKEHLLIFLDAVGGSRSSLPPAMISPASTQPEPSRTDSESFEDTPLVNNTTLSWSPAYPEFYGYDDQYDTGHDDMADIPHGSDTYETQGEFEAVRILMESFEDLLDFSEVHTDTVEAGNDPGSNIRGQSHTPEISQSDGPCKRKHSSEPDTSSESDQRKSPKTSHAKPSANLKFACPFFQKDPSKFTRRQACTGPGFSSISRVKEHLYRAHKQPDYQCIRCYSPFMSRDLLEEHQRAEVPCQISNKSPSDNINEAQYVRLRRKPNGQKTDAERWEEVYRIVFPKASVIPSCHYEFHDSATPILKAYSLGLKKMENALVEGVREDLYDHFAQVEDDLKSGFLNVVKARIELTIVSIGILPLFILAAFAF